MATDLSPRRDAELRAALVDACDQMGLSGLGAELIKYTVNAVFRLRSVPVVVRVGSGDVGEVRGSRLVKVARWLADEGAPVVRLLDGPQPVYVEGGFTVTFWHELSTEPHWTAKDLADPLQALHGLQPSSSLPRWDPFQNARLRLAAADPTVSTEDVGWLREEWAAAEVEFRRWEPKMPIGIVHGDPHTGNLLRDNAGRVVLCDLDETGIGPLAWDLVPQAVGAVRFDRDGFYREFAEVYGADVRAEPFWPALARVRELVMVTSVLPDLGQRPVVAAEHAHRLATLKAGHRTATWSLYR